MGNLLLQPFSLLGVVRAIFARGAANLPGQGGLRDEVMTTTSRKSAEKSRSRPEVNSSLGPCRGLTEKSDARSSQHVFPPHGPAPRSRRLVFGNRKALLHEEKGERDCEREVGRDQKTRQATWLMVDVVM